MDGNVKARATDGTLEEEKEEAKLAEQQQARPETLERDHDLPLVVIPEVAGRVTPTGQPSTKVDGFDVFMSLSGVVLFPLAVLLFAAPFLLNGIDVSSVGPPPMS